MNRQNIYPYSKKYCFEELMLLQQKRQPPTCGTMPQAGTGCLLPLYSNNIKEAILYSFISRQRHILHQPISISRERFSPLVSITRLYQ